MFDWKWRSQGPRGRHRQLVAFTFRSSSYSHCAILLSTQTSIASRQAAKVLCMPSNLTTKTRSHPREMMISRNPPDAKAEDNLFLPMWLFINAPDLLRNCGKAGTNIWQEVFVGFGPESRTVTGQVTTWQEVSTTGIRESFTVPVWTVSVPTDHDEWPRAEETHDSWWSLCPPPHPDPLRWPNSDSMSLGLV